MDWQGTVWVVEEDFHSLDHPCGSLWTARFSCHWQPADLWADHVSGPHCVPIETALAWSRASAPHVVVRVLGAKNEFWAGERRPPKSWGLLPWPGPDALGLVPRRPVGLEWCDRTDQDPPVAWPVYAQFDAESGALDRRGRVRGLASRVVEALSTDPAIRDAARGRRYTATTASLRDPYDPAAERAGFALKLVVLASTHQGAYDLVVSRCTDAVTTITGVEVHTGRTRHGGTRFALEVSVDPPLDSG